MPGKGRAVREGNAADYQDGELKDMKDMICDVMMRRVSVARKLLRHRSPGAARRRSTYGRSRREAAGTSFDNCRDYQSEDKAGEISPRSAEEATADHGLVMLQAAGAMTRLYAREAEWESLAAHPAVRLRSPRPLLG